MMGILKRKFAELDDSPYYSSSSSPASSVPSPASLEWDLDRENLHFPPQSPSSPTALPLRSILKRTKLKDAQRNVCFDQVTVYSFPRCQGFTSVPSHGGATLGMSRRHSDIQTYTVAEHALEQRHRRREQLRDRRRQERFQQIKHKLITSGAIGQKEAERLTMDQVPIEEAYIHINSMELEGGGFVQSYSSKQRQAILQTAGLKRIDKEEKRQLHALRLSREICGCNCQGFCEPESCACNLAGIKCQVDRFNFPCGCSQDGCGNTQGRIEFDSRRVRTHYIHTIMRLELERRLQNEPQHPDDQSKLQEDFDQFEHSNKAYPSQELLNKSCPFGFSLKEDNDLPLTMPAITSFHFTTGQLVVEDNSCSSDMTESSCSSSDSDAGPPLPKVDHGSHIFNISEYNNLSICNHVGHVKQPLTHSGNSKSTSTDFVGPSQSIDFGNTFMDIVSMTSVTECCEENANQTDENSLEDCHNTPYPTMDYLFGSYMDLSLSSDSDLEFFDSDYTSGPLHSSFKGHRHTDNLGHLQLFRSDTLPQYESSTYLLESLIGLTESGTEQVCDPKC